MAYKQVLLGDYFKFEKGLGYKGEFLADESEVALIGMDSHEEGGGYKVGSEKFYNGPYKPEHVAEVGDVIFAGTEQGFGLLASPLMVPESDKFSTYLYSGDVLKAIPLNADEFLVEYLYNLFRVKKFRVKAAYGDTGTTVRRISHENLAEQVVPLPDLSTQLAINEIISLIDQQIANNRSLSKNLELLAQSIFKSWFIDFDPVHAKSRGEKPFGMDDETAALFPDSFEESELGMIPKGWEKSVLGDVLSALESGKRPKGGAQNEGVPSLGAESIRNLGQFDFASTKYVSPQFFQSMNSGKVKPYDVLVYKDGAGAGAHVTMFGEGFPYEDFAINEHVFLLRSDQVPQSYLFFWLNNENYKSLMVELAQKSAQPGLNQKDMKSIPILKPDSSMLAAFSELISPIVEMIMENSLQSYSLGQIREVLLPRLISGELQIPEELLVS